MATDTLPRVAPEGEVTAPRRVRGAPFYGLAVGVSLAAAIASLWILPSVTLLGYDPWSWQVWGQELAHGALQTADSASSIKPLPVFVDAALSGLGSNAPWAWLVIARAGLFLSVALAYRLGTRLSQGRWVAGIFAAAAVATALELCGYLFFQGYSDDIEVGLALCAVDLFLSRRRVATFLILLVASLSRIEVSAFLAVYLGWCFWRYDRRVLTVLAGFAAFALVLFSWFGLDLISAGDAFRSAVKAQSGNSNRPIFQAHPFVAVLSEAVDNIMLPVTVAFGAEVIRGIVVWVRSRRVPPTLLLGLAALCWVAGEGLMAQLHLATGSPIYLVTGLGLGSVVAGVFVGDLAALAWRHRRSFGPLLAAVSLLGIVVGTMTAAVPWSETDQYWWNSERGAYNFSIPGAQQDAQVAAAVKAAGGRSFVLACGKIVQASPLANPVVAWALDIPFARIYDDIYSRGAVFLTDSPTDPPPPGAIRSGVWSIVEHCGA